VLSGLAEAAASGADEAIAYDALQAEGMADQWGRVLEVQMRLQSVMFILTMSAGAAVYDPDLMSRVMAALGSEARFTQDQTLRLPLYLTFLFSLITLAATWRLEEIEPDSRQDGILKKGLGTSTLDALKMTFSTGRWILKTPFVLTVILFGMLFDGVLRMVITLASQYYRMVLLPESLFGILGSVMAVAGLFIPRLARRIAENHTPAICLWATSLVALSGLSGMAFFWPTIGLVPALVAFSAMHMVGFFLSYFVNREAPSSRRATVLSFKGLAYNLSYGMIGVVYAGLLEAEKAGIGGPAVDARTVENLVFRETIFWFPVSLAAGLIVLIAGILLLRGRRT
jgi:hypothetical protein